MFLSMSFTIKPHTQQRHPIKGVNEQVAAFSMFLSMPQRSQGVCLLTPVIGWLKAGTVTIKALCIFRWTCRWWNDLLCVEKASRRSGSRKEMIRRGSSFDRSESRDWPRRQLGIKSAFCPFRDSLSKGASLQIATTFPWYLHKKKSSLLKIKLTVKRGFFLKNFIGQNCTDIPSS